MAQLDDYREIVGNEVIYSLYQKMRKLYGKHLLHINSTYIGGGVAEMLSAIVPMMNEIGIEAGWRTVHGLKIKPAKQFYLGIHNTNFFSFRFYHGPNTAGQFIFHRQSTVKKRNHFLFGTTGKGYPKEDLGDTGSG